MTLRVRAIGRARGWRTARRCRRRGQRGCCSAGWRRFRARTRAARSRRGCGRTCSTRAPARACAPRSATCVRRSAPRVCTSGRRARRSNSAATACGSTYARLPELVAAGRLEEALSLCRDEVLEGMDAEWVLDLRSRHAAERADAAVELIRAAREAGDAGAALAWARRLAAWDPLGETAQRELMLAFAEAGDRAAALRSYAEFGRRLARELRVAPSAATRELASRLRRQGLRHGPGPPAAPSALGDRGRRRVPGPRGGDGPAS